MGSINITDANCIPAASYPSGDGIRGKIANTKPKICEPQSPIKIFALGRDKLKNKKPTTENASISTRNMIIELIPIE